MDDLKKEPPLTLVADNSSAELEQKRARQESEYAEERATEAIRRLAINLLRIIAGAGEPWELLRNIDDARSRYIDYLDLAKKAGRSVEPPIKELDLDHLFSWQSREREPVTEDDWRRWAEPTDPHDEYFESRARAKLELRRAALRQVASLLSSGETREPGLKARNGN